MEQEPKPHKLTLTDRKILTVSGVTEVLRFDEESVLMQTGLGLLAVHGQELIVKNLSLEGGQVAVQGQVTALIYEAPRASGSWLRRRRE